MTGRRFLHGIPVSVSLTDSLTNARVSPPPPLNKHRTLRIALYAIAIAAVVSVVARGLVLLINAVTNFFFFGEWSVIFHSPAANTLGLWVIIVPAIGGILVGLMALYGSRAIRGHGIPEAMEQILTNKSRIKPSITYLKPLSSAIAIGTGGPFGAEGPIIATGGALGSTVGQLLRITHAERKILLVAGATAGMSAIFGSPVAAVFLAIELLLFEFSPRAIIPVALACITGAAGHHVFFESEPVFAISGTIETPTNLSLVAYSSIGVLVGILAVAISKSVYWIEDHFEKLPVHWMWWPALGGLVVGAIGYFFPHTLGVGYDNITQLLSGSLPVRMVLFLCVFKFISWAIALGSGTSGGTLAPLLTIGAACGLLIGFGWNQLFPQLLLPLPGAALVGMSAMFAGASRALLTSIAFALETTGQGNALLALLGACTAAYIISFLLMENTIMTEKIVRRGVKTPDVFEPDVLSVLTVSDAITETPLLLKKETTIGEIQQQLLQLENPLPDYFLVTDSENEYKGIIASTAIAAHANKNTQLAALVLPVAGFVVANDTLATAIYLMAEEECNVLPVLQSEKDTIVIGMLSYRHVMEAYLKHSAHRDQQQTHISLRRRGLKMLVSGRNWIKSRS